MSAVSHEIVGDSEKGMRLDRWFRARYPQLTQGQLQKLLRKGQVRVDGAKAKTSTRVEPGQEVRVPPLEVAARKPRRATPSVNPADVAFVRALVLHKDNDLIVIDKPSGLAVQGGSRTERHLDGLLDGLRFDGAERPRLVHRLDRDTSGVMVLARHRLAANALTAAFRAHRVTKTYWALVWGLPDIAAGVIDLPVFKAGRAGEQRMQAAAPDASGAQRARTRYEVVDHAGKSVSWLSLQPETGRTHQLRVHLEAIGHPILGDQKYRGQEEKPAMEFAPRLHLHAQRLEFPDEVSKGLVVEAPLPRDLAKSWRSFGFEVMRDE